MLPHFLLIVGLSIFSIAVFSKVSHSEALLYDPGVQRMIFAGNDLEREIDNLGGINRLANNSSGASAIIGLVFIMFGIASTKSHLSSTITRSLFLSSILIVLLCITALISLTYSSQFLTNKDATKQISDYLVEYSAIHFVIGTVSILGLKVYRNGKHTAKTSSYLI
ncbi:hypothetical protein A3K63_03260 [Candidatus Micrarchaeota archaeon RBG_16_49_10]|nr:MAG: hypothetical protein A3K63_03260 [Candidatus Micrarchaeota archaeon RBG_16_49_10]